MQDELLKQTQKVNRTMQHDSDVIRKQVEGL